MTDDAVEKFVTLEGGIEELPQTKKEESIYTIDFLSHIDSQEFYGGEYWDDDKNLHIPLQLCSFKAVLKNRCLA